MKNNRTKKTSNAIHDIRKQIEEIDQEMMYLLNHRFTIVNQLVDEKKKECVSIEDQFREKELLNKVNSFQTDYDREMYEVYQSIIQSSKKIQWQKIFPKSLFIIGFMGSGKTTLGKKLSDKLGFCYMDTDEVIEKKIGMTIESLFLSKGESYFREMEKQVMKDLLKNQANDQSLVISCGGGLILDKDNQKIIKKLGTIIFLDVPPDIIYHRIRSKTHRPLLNEGHDLEKRIDRILEERYETYRDVSDILIPIHHETIEESLSLIYHKLEDYSLGRSFSIE